MFSKTNEGCEYSRTMGPPSKSGQMILMRIMTVILLSMTTTGKEKYLALHQNNMLKETQWT